VKSSVWDYSNEFQNALFSSFDCNNKFDQNDSIGIYKILGVEELQ